MARRWKSLVALGVLAGLVGGLAVAAVAGARRTSTAYERFREATGRSDAIVFASLLGIRFPDYTAVWNLPEVEDAGEFVFAPVGIKEFPGSAGALHPGDDRLYRTVNRPLVVAGRLPDPGRSDELLVNRYVAKEFDATYLRNVRTLPKALAAFLVILGLGALGHVLASAVRRRRHDLAVLRAVGFRPLQVAGCVASQAVTVSLVALLVGIPLGIAAGRWAWRWVADATPLLYVPPLAGVVVLLSVPAALVLANAMAALPALRAARLRPADVLRAE